MSGVVNKKLSVYFNSKKIQISNFKSYCNYYLKGFTKKNDTEDTLTAYFTTDRWEVLAGASEGDFHQVSFVNSICTIRGGTHVDYLVNQMCEGLQIEAQKKVKKIKIKNHIIKSNIFLIVNCLIENPAFDSQTKETLITKKDNFGSQAPLTEKFMKDLLKTGIIDQIIFQAQARENIRMQNKLKGTKKVRLLGINKLEDANKAGTKDSHLCTLIVTEGDSAKALAMNGLEIVGRDYYGVYPLRGKFLNVREAPNATILKNQEVSQLIEIIGLKVGMKYDEGFASLRYGSLMIMADQDHDGSHIKGLVINFIHHFWPSLVKSNKFLKEFVTPIIKASKGAQVHPFFTIQDFKEWAEARLNDLKGWNIKYYKGLGTSDDKEAKEYFRNISIHEIKFSWSGQDDDEAVDLAFNKKKTDDRKEWLAGFDPLVAVDHKIKTLRYFDFIHKELIHFSIANNQRAIPNICDGFKTGQRKIIFSCFKRKLTKEIKVAQLAGYVAEHSEYHHGEQNLADTIIGMAQTFVGSNNINLLLPNGQFGTRAMGGKDSASARYLHTALNKITRCIFPEADDHILNYIEEDGRLVEPTYYMPVIPMVLVNGMDGIGSGWSTSIPNYCPRTICRNILGKLRGEEFFRMDPWYKGYTGEIITNAGKDNSYLSKGTFEYDDDEHMIEISELPLKKWTRDYKNYIEQMMMENDSKVCLIDDMREYHTSRKVCFKLFLSSNQRSLKDQEIEKTFKMTSTISVNNMVLFNKDLKLQKFSNELAILEAFYKIRLEHYQLRKNYLLSKITRDIEILDNKIRFLLDVTDEKVIVFKKKKKEIVKQLIERGYTKYSELPRIKSSLEDNLILKLQNKQEEAVEGQGDAEDPITNIQRIQIEEMVNPDEAKTNKEAKEFDYLVTQQIWALSEDLIEKYRKDLEKLRTDFEALNNKKIKEMWREDIEHMIEVLDKIEAEEQKQIEKDDKKALKGNNNKDGGKKRKKVKRKMSSDDEDVVVVKKPKKNKNIDEEVSKKKRLSIKVPPKKDIPKNQSSGQKSIASSSFNKENEELDKLIAKSMLSTLCTNDANRERIRKIVKKTRKELEANDRMDLSLEERLWLKELIQKDNLASGPQKEVSSFFKPEGQSKPIPVEERLKPSSRKLQFGDSDESEDEDIFVQRKRRSQVGFGRESEED